MCSKRPSDVSGYQGAITGQQQALAGALSTAEQTEYNLPQNQPVAPTSADLDTTSTSQYGQAIYKAPDGSLYDANGNPFTPPAAPAPGAGGLGSGTAAHGAVAF